MSDEEIEMDIKDLYENLDALHAALPSIAREWFAETVSEIAASADNPVAKTVSRWRAAAGYPEYVR